MGVNILRKQPPLSWIQAVHKNLEPGCRDLHPFTHKSIGEDGVGVRLGSVRIPLVPQVLNGVQVRALYRPGKFFHTKKQRKINK